MKMSTWNREAAVSLDTTPAIVAISNTVNVKIKKMLPSVMESPEYSSNALISVSDLPFGIGGALPSAFGHNTAKPAGATASTGGTGTAGGGMSGGGGTGY